jgi:hypothetical protein
MRLAHRAADIRGRLKTSPDFNRFVMLIVSAVISKAGPSPE